MSFASKARMEVLNHHIESDCCSVAFLSAIIKCAGQINVDDNNKWLVEIFTELEPLFDRVDAIVHQYYGVNCELERVEEANVSKNVRYRITLPSEITNRLLVDLDIIEKNTKVVENKKGIENFIIADVCCKKAFVMGAFVATATSNIVIKNYENITKSSSGYHLEFVFTFNNIVKDFIKLLGEFNIPAKSTVRKGSPLVYIKEYQLICDVLALVGASQAVLALQNEAAIRDLRNSVNRQTNCMSANLSKTVTAAVRQLNAINIIKEEAGLESLDDELMELCLVRIANPDESLESIRKLYKYKISKSGLNHRFNKIIAKAEKLKKAKEVPRLGSTWL